MRVYSVFAGIDSQDGKFSYMIRDELTDACAMFMIQSVNSATGEEVPHDKVPDAAIRGMLEDMLKEPEAIEYMQKHYAVDFKRMINPKLVYFNASMTH